jgi:hypothetical protein
LKPGHAAHHKKVNGHNVKCVHASEIEHVLWEVDKKIVKVCPKHCKAPTGKFLLPECLRLLNEDKAKIFPSAVQIPLISNDATTSHKLQGSSLDAVHIPSWSRSASWPHTGCQELELLMDCAWVSHWTLQRTTLFHTIFNACSEICEGTRCLQNLTDICEGTRRLQNLVVVNWIPTEHKATRCKQHLVLTPVQRRITEQSNKQTTAASQSTSEGTRRQM